MDRAARAPRGPRGLPQQATGAAPTGRPAGGRLTSERPAGSTGQPLFVTLPGGGSAGICTSVTWYPDGRTFVGAGIQPNIRVRPTVADIRSGRDPALEAALKHLREAAAKAGAPGGLF